MFILKFLESVTTKKLASKIMNLVQIENKNIGEISKKDINLMIEYIIG